MLGLRLICFEVKHQVLSCSCYAPRVLRAALKDLTRGSVTCTNLGHPAMLPTYTEPPTCFFPTQVPSGSENPGAATLWSPDPI